ncbi:MAG: hypothetical protein FWD57_02305 [Polyangiaceae bacterium]|nr:hypothetical protein [Polyangiaceae bacterium]
MDSFPTQKQCATGFGWTTLHANCSQLGACECMAMQGNCVLAIDGSNIQLPTCVLQDTYPWFE